MAFFVYILKKRPDPNDLATWIIYFAYVAELVANNEDSTHRKHKLIYNKVHVVAIAW